MPEFDYDVVVIGSGFGGSVSALRLTEKGYRLGVLEAGRRWDAETLPRSNWNLRKSLWAPELGFTGPQRISLLGTCAVFSGADGSAVTADLGVNPSLTITAQAERAMALWPNKNQADTRPGLGTPISGSRPWRRYGRRFPAAAPGALRLPLTPLRAS